jgi:hypothetical protein
MVMQDEPEDDREPVGNFATTTWERSLFSPSSTRICYCGATVFGRILCPECSEQMSRALQRPLRRRGGLEVARPEEERSSPSGLADAVAPAGE